MSPQKKEAAIIALLRATRQDAQTVARLFAPSKTEPPRPGKNAVKLVRVRKTDRGQHE